MSRPNLDVPTRARAVQFNPVPMCPVPRATPARSDTLSRKPPIPIQPQKTDSSKISFLLTIAQWPSPDRGGLGV